MGILKEQFPRIQFICATHSPFIIQSLEEGELLTLDQPLDKPLPTGARATVQLYNSEGPFARTFAGLQIHLVSWLHYVY